LVLAALKLAGVSFAALFDVVDRKKVYVAFICLEVFYNQANDKTFLKYFYYRKT